MHGAPNRIGEPGGMLVDVLDTYDIQWGGGGGGGDFRSRTQTTDSRKRKRKSCNEADLSFGAISLIFLPDEKTLPLKKDDAIAWTSEAACPKVVIPISEIERTYLLRDTRDVHGYKSFLAKLAVSSSLISDLWNVVASYLECYVMTWQEFCTELDVGYGKSPRTAEELACFECLSGADTRRADWHFSTECRSFADCYPLTSIDSLDFDGSKFDIFDTWAYYAADRCERKR